MLSYRHAFHAGNHADVLKHLTLALITKAYCRKEKPFAYFDAQAAAALYSIDDSRALQTGEAESGISALLKLVQSGGAAQAVLDSADKALLEKDEAAAKEAAGTFAEYLEFCRNLQASVGLYAGSPAVVCNFARPQDQLVLMELHPSEIEILKANVELIKKGALGKADVCNIHVHHRDGFAGLKAMLPPKQPLPARGFTLLDPSYEIDKDYSYVEDAVKFAARSWHNSAIAVWYPLVERRHEKTLHLKEACLATEQEVLCAELCIAEPENEHGLYGSGMIVVNPPWKLDIQLETLLPFLAKKLGGAGASFRSSLIYN